MGLQGGEGITVAGGYSQSLKGEPTYNMAFGGGEGASEQFWLSYTNLVQLFPVNLYDVAADAALEVVGDVSGVFGLGINALTAQFNSASQPTAINWGQPDYYSLGSSLSNELSSSTFSNPK